jgi:hypothetical protein
MPDLLEVIAENDAAVLNGWAEVYKERAPRFGELPENDRGRELLTLAREFTRRASWAVDTAEGWLTELKTRLRDGMGGHKFRALLHSGRTLCGMCRSVVEIAADLWRLTGTPAGEVLSAIGERLAAVEAEVATFTKHAERPWPEIDPERLAKGEEQIRQGKGLTREQALAAIRKSE